MIKEKFYFRLDNFQKVVYTKYIQADSERKDIMINTAIQKWGNSQGIRIPKYILEQLNIDINSAVSVSVQNDSIIIKKAAKKHIPLEKRFEDYSGEAQSGEYDWGEPRGNEIW